MPEILKKDLIAIAQVKDILEQVKPDDMDQIQRWTFDYTTKFAKVTGKQAQKMTKQLVEQCDLTPEEATEVVNVMPTTLEELRAFTFGWKKLILTETLEKMLAILKDESQG
ncbi:MAG: RNA polymerase Rpb4 [Nitrososphaera sp.]